MCDQGSFSGSMHARLQVSMHSSYDLSTLVAPKFDSYILTPVSLESRYITPTLLCIHVRCIHDANFVTTDPQVPEILHMSIFVIA